MFVLCNSHSMMKQTVMKRYISCLAHVAHLLLWQIVGKSAFFWQFVSPEDVRYNLNKKTCFSVNLFHQKMWERHKTYRMFFLTVCVSTGDELCKTDMTCLLSDKLCHHRRWITWSKYNVYFFWDSELYKLKKYVSYWITFFVLCASTRDKLCETNMMFLVSFVYILPLWKVS